jgi:hypothetical protein
MNEGAVAGQMKGSDGITRALREAPEAIKSINDTTLAQLVSLYNSTSALESVAAKLETIDATQAARLRSAAGLRR